MALPAWWLFGRRRFEGYVSARRGEDRELSALAARATEQARPFGVTVHAGRGDLDALEKLAKMPILGSNAVDILVDGEETYESMFQGMERARTTLLVLFYTVRDDEVGRRLQEILVRKASEGVMVRFFFDGAGSYHLPESWLSTLEDAGVRTIGFRLGRGVRFRSQLNFRNHRKIVVVDGREEWVGGLNIGEEYLGRDASIGEWRDTHLHLVGPAALGLQLVFVEDWHWATAEVLALDRSLLLNFEITAVLVDESTAARMGEIFEADFERCTELKKEDMERLPLSTRLGSRAARLLAPVL